MYMNLSGVGSRKPTDANSNVCVIAKANVANSGVGEGIKESRQEMLHRNTLNNVMLQVRE